MLQVKIVPVTAFAQNCSLVWDSETKEAVLIDAGGDAAVLKKEVEALGLKAKALWLTHGHLDHAGAVGELAKEWSVPVIGPHKEDQFWLDMIQEVSARYGFPIPQPVKVDQWLEGGEVLKLGEDEFEVRFAPGHTPGHVVFYNKNHGLLWTGDVLFKGSIGKLSLGSKPCCFCIAKNFSRVRSIAYNVCCGCCPLKSKACLPLPAPISTQIGVFSIGVKSRGACIRCA